MAMLDAVDSANVNIRGIDVDQLDEEAGECLTIHEHGVMLVLHGPYPSMVIDMVENQKGFSSKGAMIRWLDAFWPGWREQLVYSEGL